MLALRGDWVEQVTREVDLPRCVKVNIYKYIPHYSSVIKYGNGARLDRDEQITEKWDSQEHFLASNHFATSQDSRASSVKSTSVRIEKQEVQNPLNNILPQIEKQSEDDSLHLKLYPSTLWETDASKSAATNKMEPKFRYTYQVLIKLKINITSISVSHTYTIFNFYFKAGGSLSRSMENLLPKYKPIAFCVFSLLWELFFLPPPKKVLSLYYWSQQVIFSLLS